MFALSGTDSDSDLELPKIEKKKKKKKKVNTLLDVQEVLSIVYSYEKMDKNSWTYCIYQTYI